MQILIKNGRLLDPESGTDKVTDVLIEDGVVTMIGADLKLPAPAGSLPVLWICMFICAIPD